MATEKLKVLVADSRLIRKAFSRVLGEAYELVEVDDGEEAWEQLQEQHDICAVFCDAKLPHLSGIDLLLQLRGHIQPRLRAMPVVLMTGDSDGAVRARALEAGASDFIAKPFDASELLARAKAHVKPRNMQGNVDDIGIIDPVTQLGNKPFFVAQGSQMASFANRHHCYISMILLSIDGYEDIVRSYKDRPDVLDSLLNTVGSFLAAEVRKEDYVARLEGSVFGLLLASTDMLGAINLAQRVSQKIGQQTFLNNLHLSLSIGVACPQANAERQYELIFSQASEQLDLARAQGNVIRPALEELKPPVPEVVESLDECLDIITNAKATVVDPEYLVNQLFPLLAYCDKRLGLRLTENVLHLIKRK